MKLNKVYNNILEKSECEEISREFSYLIARNIAKLETNIADYTNSENVKGMPLPIGYPNPKKSLKYVKKIEEVIFKDYGSNLKFANSYIRKYYNHNCLAPHIDRKNLDVTISITIDGVEDWPLCVSDIPCDSRYLNEEESNIEEYKKEFTKYYTKIGDGVACYGRHAVHWRDPLPSDKQVFLVQLFYHWTFV